MNLLRSLIGIPQARQRDIIVCKLDWRGNLEQVTVKCDDNTPMSEFYKMASICPGQYILTRAPNAATVGMCGIDQCVTVLEACKCECSWKLSVVLPCGRIIAVPFYGMMEVQALKNYVERWEGIPYDKQRLIFNGRQLMEPTERLFDCGARPGSRLYVVLRLLG